MLQCEPQCLGSEMPVGPSPTSTCTIQLPIPTGHPNQTQNHPANTGTLNSSALGPGPGCVFLSERPADIKDKPCILLFQVPPSLYGVFPHCPRHRDDIFRMPFSTLPWEPQTSWGGSVYPPSHHRDQRKDTMLLYKSQAVRALRWARSGLSRASPPSQKAPCPSSPRGSSDPWSLCWLILQPGHCSLASWAQTLTLF